MYQLLAVPEVWIYCQEQLNIYGLTESGYGDRPTSPTFPTAKGKALPPQYVERAWAPGSRVALQDSKRLSPTFREQPAQ